MKKNKERIKIWIDPDTKIIHAYTTDYGKTIMAKATCNPEDEYNYEFGIQLATKKLKIKQRYERIKHFENSKRFTQDHINRLKKAISVMEDQCKSYEKSAEYHDIKLQAEIQDCTDFVNDYFNKSDDNIDVNA